MTRRISKQSLQVQDTVISCRILWPAGAIAVLLGVAPLMLQSWHAALAGDARIPCRELTRRTVSAKEIGLATRGAVVESAEETGPKDPEGHFCKVLGVIRSVDPKAEAIHFEVNLPIRWNGKAVQIGGGGYDGVLVEGLDLDSKFARGRD